MGGPDRIVGEDSAASGLWCQEKRLQGIVVGLPRLDEENPERLIVLELARADDVSGDEESCGEGEVNEGVGNCVWTAGSPGEI